MNGCYDFLLLKKDLKNDKLNFDYLSFIKEVKEIGYSKLHFSLVHEYKELKLIYIPEFNKLQIALNIPYFLFGNNYQISIEDERNVLEYVSLVLETNLFNADVQQFEFGALFQIPFTYKKIQASHLKIKGMQTSCFDNGKYFTNSVVQHRIYDASKNFKDKLNRKEIDDLIASTDYNENTNYIKIENRYRKPDIALKKRGITVENLFQHEFIQICKTDLMEKYKAIIKVGGVQVSNSKQLTSEALYLIAMQKLEEITGMNTRELVKNTINDYSDVLSKEEKKSRMRQLKKNLEKVQPVKSPYDVSELLNQSLFGNK